MTEENKGPELHLDISPLIQMGIGVVAAVLQAIRAAGEDISAEDLIARAEGYIAANEAARKKAEQAELDALEGDG